MWLLWFLAGVSGLFESLYNSVDRKILEGWYQEEGNKEVKKAFNYAILSYLNCALWTAALTFFSMYLSPLHPLLEKYLRFRGLVKPLLHMWTYIAGMALAWAIPGTLHMIILSEEMGSVYWGGIVPAISTPSSVILGIFFLREVLNTYNIIGIILVITVGIPLFGYGHYKAEREKRKKKRTFGNEKKGHLETNRVLRYCRWA